MAVVWLLAQAVWAAEWYVAPDGTVGGDGSRERPWSLEAALAPHPKIAPMDTVWLRKGIYNGAFVGRVKGKPGKPVVVRAYPGERVVLDGRGFSPKAVLTIEGEWAWYWGLEVTNSDPNRLSTLPGSNHEQTRGGGISMMGANTKVINCVVHDAGVGVGMGKGIPDMEVYGTVIYNNGWRAPDRTHGHSIYAQNSAGEKWIRETILFNPYSFNMHIYGSKNSALDHFRLEGNVGFNGRWLIGGDAPVRDLVMRETLLYGNTAELRYTNRQNEDLLLEKNYLPVLVSAGQGWNRVMARGNTFLRPGNGGALVEVTVSAGHELKESVFDGNVYVAGQAGQGVVSVLEPGASGAKRYAWAEWQAAGFDRNGRLEVMQGGRPKEAAVFVRRNEYEPERAHVVIYNWPLLDEVEVDIKVMHPRPGDRWTLRNVQNYFEEAVSGVYEGKPLRVPMKGWTAAAPVGEDMPLSPVTFPEFGVFVLTLERAKGTQTVNAADPRQEGWAAPGALVVTRLEGLVAQPAVAEAPYGEELAGVRVRVTDAAGREAWARVAAVHGEGVVWEAPEGLETGWARVRVFGPGGEVDTGGLLVRESAPALFSADGSGTGEALGWSWNGEDLALLGTGLRGARGRVWAEVAGKEVEVRGVERQEYPGLDVVRVRLPALGAMAGVRVGVDGQVSNEVGMGVR